MNWPESERASKSLLATASSISLEKASLSCIKREKGRLSGLDKSYIGRESVISIYILFDTVWQGINSRKGEICTTWTVSKKSILSAIYLGAWIWWDPQNLIIYYRYPVLWIQIHCIWIQIKKFAPIWIHIRVFSWPCFFLFKNNLKSDKTIQ